MPDFLLPSSLQCLGIGSVAYSIPLGLLLHNVVHVLGDSRVNCLQGDYPISKLGLCIPFKDDKLTLQQVRKAQKLFCPSISSPWVMYKMV